MFINHTDRLFNKTGCIFEDGRLKSKRYYERTSVSLSVKRKTPLYALTVIFRKPRVITGKDILPDEEYNIVANMKNTDKEALKSIVVDAYREAFDVNVEQVTKEQSVFLVKERSDVEFQAEKASKDARWRRGTAVEGYTFDAHTLDQFARFLEHKLDRPVVHETERTGKYNFTLTVSSVDKKDQLIRAVKQLGFELNEAKREMPTLVIESISDPDSSAK